MVMLKEKISATVDPGRLANAKELLDSDNTSAVLDEALRVLIEREKERRWLNARPAEDLPGQVPPNLSGLEWDD